MIEIKKENLGYFVAYFNGQKTEYSIHIASHPSGTKGKSFYDVYKNEKRLNSPIVVLNIHRAKKYLIREFNLNQK
jgi:hypothetical protein